MTTSPGPKSPIAQEGNLTAMEVAHLALASYSSADDTAETLAPTSTILAFDYEVMMMRSRIPKKLTPTCQRDPAGGGQLSHGSASRRPLPDVIEVRAPGIAALANRLILRMPSRLRRRLLTDAFTRAENAFNRADFEAIFALFADDVEHVPPPALHAGQPIVGKAAVLRFWQDVLRRYDRNRITNLSLEETNRNRFVRTARLSHDGPAGTIEYVIRQTTELRHGQVVRQVNEEL